MPQPSPERAAALVAGESFYFTGKPCNRGHISKRTIVGSRCAKCASEDSLKCAAKRPENPARIAARAAGERYYVRDSPCKHGHPNKWLVSSGYCSACGIERMARWNSKNPDYDHTGMTRKRRAKDPTRHRAASLKWAKNNRDKVYDAMRRWKADNIEHVRASGRAAVNRRRTRVAGNGGAFTADDIAAILLQQNGRCAVCPCEENLEIDHVVPIFRGGSSDPSNLQLLCRRCNRSKGSKTMEAWLLGKVQVTLASALIS